MWTDNDIDKAFQRLSPPEPELVSFPLDAWLRLETQLDEAVIVRAVRRRVWRLFAAEVAVVALAVLGWLLWPTKPGAVPAQTTAATTPRPVAGRQPAGQSNAHIIAPATSPLASVKQLDRTATTAPTAAASAVAPSALAPLAPTPSAPARSAEGTRPESPITAVRPARAGPAATPEAPARPGYPKLRAAELLAAQAGAARRKTTGRTFAGGPREQAVGRAATPVAPVPSAAGRRATLAPATLAATTPAVAARTRRSTTVAGARGQRKIVPAAVAAADGPLGIPDAGASAASAPTSAATSEAPAPASAATSSAPAPAPASASAPAATSAAPAPARSLSSKAGAAGALPTRLVALRLLPIPALPAPLPATTVARTEPVAAAIPPTPARQPRFWLGLVVAPDVSTVKLTQVQAPLPNLGLTLDYRLSPRLCLSTGLLRATKRYSARREDYDWGTTAPRTYQRDFQDVDATCTVLDVPLNLRYDLLTRPRYRLVGSAGLSSFFMQRERYTYAYLENNLPRRWERNVVNENRHLLSILNLSLGYEGRLSDHWRFQAEPYLKLPLAGVGAGKVRLTSAGVFMGVKYGFN